MRKIEDVILKDGKNLKYVLKLHKKWLEEEGGKKANLSCEDLSDVDLSNSDLRYVILESANLEGADLAYANLKDANLKDANLESAYLEKVNLRNANLKSANLSYACLIDACLIYANLESSNLESSNLRSANLRGADLIGTNLSDAYLRDANLRSADLSYANLSYANLRGAYLSYVDLTDTNLTKANLIDADLTGIKYYHTTSFFALQCPEKGSFIGYKKANDKIVELLITEDSKRSSATTRECRCSKAKVLSITSLDGKEEYTDAISNYDSNFVYEVGKVIEVENFDENRWNKCSNGIHFFITRNEAVRY